MGESTSNAGGRRPRHEWGAERDTTTLPLMHPKPSATKILVGRLAIVVTVVCWAVYAVNTVLTRLINQDVTTVRMVVETLTYLLVVTFLSFSAVMYLVSRQGALTRFRSHERAPRAILDAHFAHAQDRTITVLVPSYVEEIRVVEKTLWSAALQEFPNLRVVLLIDDPPSPTDPQRLADLEATRHLGEVLNGQLRTPADRMRAARDRALPMVQGVSDVGGRELAHLSAAYRWATTWVESFAASWRVEDHTDEFFVRNVLGDLAQDLRGVSEALDTAVTQGGSLPGARVEQLYDRLVWTFQARVLTFERKRYASLSHEANKAMNLNAYISLMGHGWKRVESPRGVVLREAGPGEFADFVVPDSDYLLTLDADSMLLREYCLRLVHLMESAGNEHVAVAQTPYCSYRGAPTRMERLAAATTDVQHILHQGLTHYDATFWVGANAVIRRGALEDIAQVSQEGVNTVTTYIQDRTVIEDTESSVDLGLYGWHLLNYPERLSYSATPPDFGSLVVQRRRWANGGLLILPKFLRQMRTRRGTQRAVRPLEAMLRINYMASIAWASLGLVLLLGYPFDSRLLSPWVVAAAAPYFLCMSQDLKDSRYKRLDIFRIYGFNLILLAVNVAGTLKSIQQGLTNEKIPFARTPKVANRTASPWVYTLMPWVIVWFSCLILFLDWRSHNWGNAVFAGFNALMCLWALVSCIGIGHSIQDTVLGLVGWFFVPVKQGRKTDGISESSTGHGSGVSDSQASWKDVIFYGHTAGVS